jgi:hypothetical protein
VGYTHEDGVRFLYASAATYCAPRRLKTWDCGKPCEQLSDYSLFYNFEEEFPKYSISFIIIVSQK